MLDDQKRYELMIIYGEDVGPTGFTASELGDFGKARDHWSAVEAMLIERATNQLSID